MISVLKISNINRNSITTSPIERLYLVVTAPRSFATGDSVSCMNERARTARLHQVSIIPHLGLVPDVLKFSSIDKDMTPTSPTRKPSPVVSAMLTFAVLGNATATNEPAPQALPTNQKEYNNHTLSHGNAPAVIKISIDIRGKVIDNIHYNI